MSQSTSKTPDAPTPKETADYMADITLELLRLAKSQKLRALEQIYEKAYYEAYSRAHLNPPSPSQLEEWEDFMREVNRQRKNER